MSRTVSPAANLGSIITRTPLLAGSRLQSLIDGAHRYSDGWAPGIDLEAWLLTHGRSRLATMPRKATAPRMTKISHTAGARSLLAAPTFAGSAPATEPRSGKNSINRAAIPRVSDSSQRPTGNRAITPLSA